jgi:hypothetical protein
MRRPSIAAAVAAFAAYLHLLLTWISIELTDLSAAARADKRSEAYERAHNPITHTANQRRTETRHVHP